MENYYVLRDDKKIYRIAKIVDNSNAYGWENGEWVPMSGLLKIENDGTTDYEKISKKEADNLTGKEVKE